MTTRELVTERAHLFGWGVSVASCAGANYVRGDRCIQVDYSKDGSILNAARYRFFKLDDLHLEERASGKHKKETVISWLAS